MAGCWYELLLAAINCMKCRGYKAKSKSFVRGPRLAWCHGIRCGSEHYRNSLRYYDLKVLDCTG